MESACAWSKRVNRSDCGTTVDDVPGPLTKSTLVTNLQHFERYVCAFFFSGMFNLFTPVRLSFLINRKQILDLNIQRHSCYSQWIVIVTIHRRGQLLDCSVVHTITHTYLYMYLSFIIIYIQ